ncbi:MAG: hypothetical protein HRU09_16870 [Oligoflexales bacterium]|nr:hypothetical protein [Oligoflexales bacterium]
MQDRYYSDDICQIKRYKGRRKFEIFIHNKEFRELATKLNLRVFKEDLNETRVIDKKILSPSLGYTRYLQACYGYIWQQSKKGNDAATIQKYLEYLVEDCVNKLRINDISDEEKYAIELDKTYQLIRSRIKSN